VGYGLLLQRVESYWPLAAQPLYGVLAEGATGMLLNFDDFQRVTSLRAGANVSLADADGVVTVSADVAQADLVALAARLTGLERASQPLLSNGPLPEGNVLTLFQPELARIDRIQVGAGLELQRVEGYWTLAALPLRPPLEEPAGAVSLLDGLTIKSLLAGANVSLAEADGIVTISATLRRPFEEPAGAVSLLDGSVIKSLLAGANVSLPEAAGIVTISASVDAVAADVAFLAARLDDLVLTSQPRLVNGPLPPGEQILSLLVPELARVDRIEIGYGLVLQRVEPAGYWKLSAQGLLGVLAPGAIPLISSTATEQAIKSLQTGPNVAL
jgi:hypothetical protein